MAELRTIELGDVAIREGSDGRRTVSGYAYRWGELSVGATKEAGGLREGYERGAFQISERLSPYLDTHYSRGGRSVGGIVFSEDDIGLRYEGALHKSGRAQEYAAELDGMGGTGAVSLEVMIDTSKSVRRGGAVIHHSARPVALAGVPYGAFEGATVAIREVQDVGEEMEVTVERTVDLGDKVASVVAGTIPLSREETIAIARGAAEEVARAFAERSGQVTTQDPIMQFKTLGELVAAAERGDAPKNYVALAYEIAERALADIVTTAGANAALLTGNLTVREVAGIVSRGRPAITAFGGPLGIPEGSGLTVSWPYFDGTLTDYVAAQSAQKAEIESATVDIKLGSEAIVTYAGGADIAYQLIRQGDPAILDVFARIMLAAWSVVTDAAFVTELESGSVTSDLGEAQSAEDLTEFTNRTIDNAIAVQTATGLPAEFILASTTTFAQFAKLLAAKSTTVELQGEADIRGLSFGLGGLPLIHTPSMTAGKRIVSNSLAARWHEAGPFQASAENVALLGRDVAYWSLGAGARYIPAGIIEVYDVTP